MEICCLITCLGQPRTLQVLTSLHNLYHSSIMFLSSSFCPGRLFAPGFLLSTPVFCLYHYHSSSTPSLLVGNTSGKSSRFFFVAPIGWSGCLVFPILLLPGVYCKPRGEDLFLVTCLWTLFFTGWASLETCPPFFCLPLISPSNSDANYSQVKPAGIPCHSRSRKGPVPRWTCLWSSKTL